MRRLLLSEDLVEAMASTRPYLGLEIMEQGFYEIEDYQGLWFAALLADPRSVLHYEIRNNQNVTGAHRYLITPENKILNYYFSDVTVAQDRYVYRGFGGFAQSDLLSRHGLPGDRYNRPLGEFTEGECWESGFHSALRLFDIMIPEAFYQSIKWHMWLFYLPSFVDGILRNLKPTPEVDLSGEWPTPYHYFLYEIVSMLRWWVGMVEDVPVDQENAILSELNTRHDNANIPKSAAIALGAIIEKIILSDKLTEQFKRYLLEIPVRQSRDLIQSDCRPEYGKLLLMSVARAGYHGRTDGDYPLRIQAAFSGLDHVLLYELEDEWAELFD